MLEIAFRRAELEDKEFTAYAVVLENAATTKNTATKKEPILIKSIFLPITPE